jgi:hypothetical protein
MRDIPQPHRLRCVAGRLRRWRSRQCKQDGQGGYGAAGTSDRPAVLPDILPNNVAPFPAVDRRGQISHSFDKPRDAISDVASGAACHNLGVGGAGKTRLAIAVSKRCAACPGAKEDCEVYWVPLAAVVDPTELPTAVATGLGLTGPLSDRPLAPALRASGPAGKDVQSRSNRGLCVGGKRAAPSSRSVTEAATPR